MNNQEFWDEIDQERGVRAVEYKIHEGPDKDTFFHSLREGSMSANTRQAVVFTTSAGDMFVVIDGIIREDGSGESWLFTGFLATDNRKVKGYYSTSDYRGSFSLSN